MRERVRRPPMGVVATALLLLGLSGCMRGCPSSRPPIHLNPNMDHQPKAKPQSESGFFYDGASMRRPVPGTLAQGERPTGDPFRTGKDAAGAHLTAPPLPVDDALLARGRARFGIYCTPCHGSRGDGRGMLFERAGVQSGNLFDERIRGLAVGEIFEVISDGRGLMAGYRYPVPARDRWAIAAFVKAWQRGELPGGGGG